MSVIVGRLSLLAGGGRVGRPWLVGPGDLRAGVVDIGVVGRGVVDIGVVGLGVVGLVRWLGVVDSVWSDSVASGSARDNSRASARTRSTTSMTSASDMAPTRRNTGSSRVQSTIVEARPPVTGPPSR